MKISGQLHTTIDFTSGERVSGSIEYETGWTQNPSGLRISIWSFPGFEPQFLGHSALTLVAISTLKTGTRIIAPRLRKRGKYGG